MKLNGRVKRSVFIQAITHRFLSIYSPQDMCNRKEDEGGVEQIC